MRAMESKALEYVSMCDQIIRRLSGFPGATPITPGAARTILNHLEFRLAHEFKGTTYKPHQTVKLQTVVSDMTDEQLEDRYRELRARSVAEAVAEDAARETRH